jgi:hypothetical protein
LTGTLALEARPELHFELYHSENTTAVSGRTTHNGALSYFAFAPALDASLQWQIAPKIVATTGVRFDLLRLEAKTCGKGDAWTEDTGRSWSAAGAKATGGGLAFAWSPSEHFTVEAGLDSLFDFNESEYKTDMTKLWGSFSCLFRL